MRQLFIILTLTLLFWGCGSSDKTTTENLSSYSTNVVKITSIHSNSNTTELTKSNQTYIEYVTTIGINGEALDIILSNDGNFAYVASGDFGLQILDISNPNHPKLIGTHDSYGYVNHVERVKNVVFTSYIAQTWDDYERINSYDVTHPNNPKYIDYHEGYTSNDHQSVELNGYHYYLSNESLYAVNIRRNYYQSYLLYSPYALAVSDGYAFIANGRDGVTIFKVNGEITSTLVNP